MAEDIDLAGLLKQFMTEYGAARSDRQGIYEAGQADLSKVAEAHQPGGGMTSGLLQESMAPIEQSMVSRGLSGTTRPGAVRAGMAADIEAQRMKGLAGAKTAKAEFGAGFQDIYPSAGVLSHLATGGFSGLLSREIAEAGARPDYTSRVDYSTPTPTSRTVSSSAAESGVVGPSLTSRGTDKYSDGLFDQLGGGSGTGEHFPTDEDYTLFRPGEDPLKLAEGETLFPAGGGEPITARPARAYVNPEDYRIDKGGYEGLMEAYAAAAGHSL